MKLRTYKVYTISPVCAEPKLLFTIENISEVRTNDSAGIYKLFESITVGAASPYDKDYKFHYFPISTTILKEV